MNMDGLEHSESVTRITNVKVVECPETKNEVFHGPRGTTATTNSRLSELSLLHKKYEEVKTNEIEDRSWSFGYLRKRFKTGNLEDLYGRYVQRMKVSYFLSYLLLQMFVSCALLIAEAVESLYDEQVDLEAAVPEIIRQISILTVTLLLYWFLRDDKIFFKYPFLNIVSSIIIVSSLHLSDIGVSLYYLLRDEDSPMQTLSTMYVLIVVYHFLPIRKKTDCIILGSLVSITSIVCDIIFYSVNNMENYTWKASMIDAIYYLCGNLIGLSAQFLREINVRRSFLDRRSCLKSTLRNNIEKEKSEQLLQSMLPKDISEKVKEELREALELVKSHRNSHRGRTDSIVQINRRKHFSDLFVERHSNLSILFADIVNFTKLAGKLKAQELVECLNSLYREFDLAAKNQDCLRIKLLGDCYYCVSSKAKNCVELGWDMIEIIKTVVERYEVNVSMRIGIHTGNVFSGIIGIYKWQYDIWSKDVTIANCMESSGKPGYIHVSKATKDFLGDEYEFKIGDGHLRNDYLKENNVETFFVTSQKRCEGGSNVECMQELDVQESGSPGVRTRKSYAHIVNPNTHSDTFPTLNKRAYTAGADLEVDIGKFLHIQSEVDFQMGSAIDNMPFSKATYCCCCTRRSGGQNMYEDLSPVLMNFDRISSEIEFQCQHDPLFKFYVTGAFVVFILKGAMSLLSENSQLTFWIAYACVICLMTGLTLVLWTPYLWHRFKDPFRDSMTDIVIQPKNMLLKASYFFSIAVTKQILLRTVLYIFITLLIAAFAIIDVVWCNDVVCCLPWYFTFNYALALMVVYSFIRIHFLLKLLISIISLIGYGFTISRVYFDQFETSNTKLHGISAAIGSVYSHVIYLVAIILLLHTRNRQMEYINRLNFIWRNKLNEENDEASTTHEINRILIQNILPMEIANIYLDPKRVFEGEGYSRPYNNISVMFATIPKFMDSFSDKDIEDCGYFLKILHEIIVEFDQELLNFVDIEKIKVVGSTYMAACGLEVQGSGRLSRLPGAPSSLADTSLNSSESSENLRRDIQGTKTLVNLVKFSASLMTRLDSVNTDAFQDFKLRVGIACGPLVAGVIGAEKPMYDIWGDTVNLASRMDSTGVAGNIQVSAESAKLLTSAGVKCCYRGIIDVKGKGLLKTYFVPLTSEYQLMNEEALTSTCYITQP